MRSELAQVACASLPLAALAALGDLRRTEGISVTVEGDRAWVCWDAGDESILRRVLPLPGAELYSKRAGQWYRLGARLPSFGLPIDRRGADSHPLHRAIVPRPVWPKAADDGPVEAVELALVRDDQIRAASGLRCSIDTLARWANAAPTARFSGLLGAMAEGLVLVVGNTLPELTGAGVERFWGSRLLAPMGLRPQPFLPEQALRRALGIAENELPLLCSGGVEVIPYAVLRPLSRAGVRIAAAQVLVESQAPQYKDVAR